MNETELKTLAKLIAEETTRELVNFEDVCAMFRYSKGAVAVRKIVTLPDFPKPIKFAEGSGNRWRRQDVSNWIAVKAKRLSSSSNSSNSSILNQGV